MQILEQYDPIPPSKNDLEEMLREQFNDKLEIFIDQLWKTLEDHSNKERIQILEKK